MGKGVEAAEGRAGGLGWVRRSQAGCRCHEGWLRVQLHMCVQKMGQQDPHFPLSDMMAVLLLQPLPCVVPPSRIRMPPGLVTGSH